MDEDQKNVEDEGNAETSERASDVSKNVADTDAVEDKDRVDVNLKEGEKSEDTATATKISEDNKEIMNQPAPTVPVPLEVLPSVPEKSDSLDAIKDQETKAELTEVTVASQASAELHSTVSLVPTGFDQQVSPSFLKEKFSIVAPGTKDSEGFLAPPPASTLLIRRARVSGTGASTYVVSKSDSNPTVESDGIAYGADYSPHSVGNDQADQNRSKPARRRPGRPVGSTCKFKKSSPSGLDGLGQVHGPAEVRVSSRSSSSIFKHDGNSPAMSSYESSQWIYPLPFRPPHMSGGKPPMTNSHHKPYPKSQKKDRVVNIDPLTGKRRYTKRKKLGIEKKQKGVSFESEHIQIHGRPKQHLSDNGVWRPTDDLRLIVNATAVEDLEKVYVGVKFSCYFSYKEIEDRWRKLLYGEKSSLVAQNAINALHPQVKAMIYSEALFSPEEEKLITSIKSIPLSNPEIESFQSLLDDNLHVFNKHRTARSLLTHWLDMRDFNLLPDQDVMDYSTPHNFEDFEETVVDEEIQNEPNDDAIAQEIKNEDRNLKKKIRIVEDEITAWHLLIEQIMADGRKDRTLPVLPTEFDNKTFAILRGRQVLYVMTSREITLGRSTKENKVDADLTQEGSSNKISRKQAVIKLKDMGKFVIINKGRHPIFIDRKAVSYKCAATLHDQSVIQIAHISLIFLINEPLIEKLVERDVRREVYSSFRDLDTDLPSTPSKSSPYSNSYQSGSPRTPSLYTDPTTPPSKSNLFSSFGGNNHSPNWGYNYSIGSTENPPSIANIGSNSNARTDAPDGLRYNFTTGLSTRGYSAISTYQSPKYSGIPSSSKGLIPAGLSPHLISNVKPSNEIGTTVSEFVDIINTDAPSSWESPVSSLSQCSIGQMSGSVSSVHYSEEVVSQPSGALPFRTLK